MPGIFNYIRKLVICLLMLVGSLAQASTDIVLLLSSDSKPYQEVTGGIRSVLSLKDESYAFTTITLDNLLERRETLPEKYAVLVTVGTRATRYAIDEKISETIFATFVTRSSLSSELTSGQQFPQQLKGALVLDQPAQRIVALARLINPQARNLGTAVNGSSPSRLDEFSRAVKKTSLRLNVATLYEDSNPIGDLKSIFSSSDVFVVTPDKARFNSKIAKWVLFLSYRHHVPVIGYSQKYTDAGALVSLFSTPGQIGRDTGERVHEGLADRRRLFFMPRLLSPRYFTLTVNDKVANSLALDIDSVEQLQRRLMDKRQLGTADSMDDSVLPLGSDQ